jgi:iron(III) transport system permease protein
MNRAFAVTPIAVAACLTLAALLPVAFVLWRGLAFAARVLERDTDVLLTTLLLVGAGTLLCVIVGGGLALLVYTAGLPRWADALVGVPYLVPPFIGATAWIAALEAGNPVTGSRIVPVYGVAGILLAWTTHYAPLAYLLIKAALEAQSPSYAQAARVHGLRAWHTLKRVTLPLATPGVFGATVLVALTLLGNFGVPQVLGLPERVYTLATLTYARLLNPTLDNPLGAASGVAMVLVLASLPALALRANVATSTPSLGERPRAARAWALAGVALWFAVAAVLPLLSLVILAFKPAYSAGVTLEHFQNAFSLSQVRVGLGNSLLLAVVSAFLAAGLGLLLALVEPRSPTVRLLNRALSLSYLLPGAIVALGFILAYGGLRGFYATPMILFAAYLVRFVTPGLENARSGLMARGRTLELAARVHGLNAHTAFWRVTLPLLRPFLVATVLLVFPLALSEITLSSILYAPGAETVGVAVLGLLNEGDLRSAAAVALVLVLLSLPTLLVSRRVAGSGA